MRTPISPFVITASAQKAKNPSVRIPLRAPLLLRAIIKQNMAADMKTETAISSVTICPSA